MIDTEATSSPALSSATSAITGAQVVVPALTPLLGGVLVDTGANVIRATATCPTGGTPTATVDPLVGVLVAGQAVTFDANGDADVLLGVAGLPVGDVALHLHDTITTSNTASAAALRLTFAVNVPAVASVNGSITIAQASCESTTAASTVPAVTDIDPDQGPTAGGTSVTITGTAFVPDQTSVTIGGNTVPADQVDVDPSGTSLTFATPAHNAGLVDVTVSTPGGTSPVLGYTYVPPVAVVAPTTTGIVPDQGPTSGGTTVTITRTGFVPGSTTVMPARSRSRPRPTAAPPARSPTPTSSTAPGTGPPRATATTWGTPPTQTEPAAGPPGPAERCPNRPPPRGPWPAPEPTSCRWPSPAWPPSLSVAPSWRCAAALLVGPPCDLTGCPSRTTPPSGGVVRVPPLAGS